jgi:hypothetical protein
MNLLQYRLTSNAKPDVVVPGTTTMDLVGSSQDQLGISSYYLICLPTRTKPVFDRPRSSVHIEFEVTRLRLKGYRYPAEKGRGRREERGDVGGHT